MGTRLAFNTKRTGAGKGCCGATCFLGASGWGKVRGGGAQLGCLYSLRRAIVNSGTRRLSSLSRGEGQLYTT